MYARKREAINKRGIGPVFLRRHRFGPEFVLRAKYRVKALLRCLAASQSRHPYRHTPYVSSRASFRHDALSLPSNKRRLARSRLSRTGPLFGPEFVRLSFHAPTTTDMYLPCTVIPLRAHLTTSLKLKYGVRSPIAPSRHSAATFLALRRVCPAVLNIEPASYGVCVGELASEEQLPLLSAQSRCKGATLASLA